MVGRSGNTYASAECQQRTKESPEAPLKGGKTLKPKMQVRRSNTGRRIGICRAVYCRMMPVASVGRVAGLTGVEGAAGGSFSPEILNE